MTMGEGGAGLSNELSCVLSAVIFAALSRADAKPSCDASPCDASHNASIQRYLTHAEFS